MFRVTIEEVQLNPDDGHAPESVKRYEQTVDMLDLPAVMAAVNRKPRKPRARKGDNMSNEQKIDAYGPRRAA